MTLLVKDGTGVDKYLHTIGLGTIVDPFILTNINYPLEVSKGSITGASALHKFGLAKDVDEADLDATIWDGMDDDLATGKIVEYTYSATADIDSMASENAGDTIEITVEGLDANYDFVEQSKTLTGQTPVTLDTPLLRVFRAYNSSGTDLLGHVFLATSGTVFLNGVPQTAANVRAIVHFGVNQTQMAMYTVPNGKSLYITHGWSSMARQNSGYAVVQIFQRSFGGVFRILHTLSLNSVGTCSDHRPYQVPLKLPARTDLIYKVAEVSANGIGISAGFHGMLVDG